MEHQRYNHQNVGHIELLRSLRSCSVGAGTLHRFNRQYNFGQARQGGAAASFGQLVRLGFDVTVFTPASYRRHRL